MTSINLLQYLETVAQTPSGVLYLQRLILDMAVHGQLSQNTADESVAVLLEKIAVEKKESEKLKKRKLTKPSPPAGRGGALFSIPEDWAWVQLREIGDIFHGNSMNAVVKKEKYTAVKNGIPYIGTKDVGYGWDTLNYENGVSVPKGEPKFAVAHKGAVLICSEGGSAGKKCGIADREICFGNKLIAIELYGGIVPDYVLSVYQTSMFSKLFSDNMNGLIGGISMSNFGLLMIPLPSLAEQKFIAAKVNVLMKLCDKLRMMQIVREESRRGLAAGVFSALKSTQSFAKNGQFMLSRFDDITACVENITTLREAILDMAVHGGLTSQNSKCWKQATFGDICLLEFGDRITKGRDAGTKHPVYGGGGATFRTDKYNREDRYVVSRFAMSEKCVRFVDGKFWLIDSGGTYSIQKKYADKVLKEFVGVFLLSAQKRIYDLSRGMAQRNLDVGSFKLLNVPIPPITEQKQIVAKVNVLMKLCDKLELALIDLETNRHRYLRAHISAG